MIILIVFVVGSDLDGGLLRYEDTHNRLWCRKGSGQQWGTDVTICKMHFVLVKIKMSAFEISAFLSVHLERTELCPTQHRCIG